MKSKMLPVIAALIIAILVVPIAALPSAYALTPVTGYLANVVTIPEDNAKLNMGMMFLGIDPTSVESVLTPGMHWYTDSLCSASVTTAPSYSATLGGVPVGPALSSEPVTTGSSWTIVTYYQPVSTVPGAACIAYEFLAAYSGIVLIWYGSPVAAQDASNPQRRAYRA